MPRRATYGLTDKHHIHEVDTMNKIMELLQEFDFAAQDRILTWVQMKVELDWDD